MAIESTGVKNPRGRGLDKRKAAMIWLNRWGYATPQTLAEALDLDRTAGPRLVAQLVQRDLVREVAAGGQWGYWRYGINAETGRRERQGPYVVMLTEVGKTTAVACDNTLGAPWERQVSGVQSIRHNLITQRFMALLLHSRGYTDYLPEPSARAASKDGIKQPDVVAIKNTTRVAIEIELTPKSLQTGALERALQAVAQGVNSKRFDQLVYVFGSDHFRQAYERVWQRGKLAEWEKKGSRWEPTGQFWQIPDHVKARVAFIQSDLLLGDLS
ncbi:MAG: hypothetical protein Q8L72_12755 [Moraxellaceae bacterium]|nr:hypothetical protein [Moraxellaceae bacterium]